MTQQRGRVGLLIDRGRETARRSRTTAQREPSSGFTVLSCNIGNGLADPGLLVDYLGRSGASIVGLQEVSEQQASHIERELAECFPHRLLRPGGFAGKGVLSTHPLAEGASVAFAPDRPDLNTAVDIGGRRLQVIVAHPRPPRVSRTGMHFDEVTENQVRMVGELAVSTRPAVVLCDLNTISLQQAYRQLLATGLIDPFRHAGQWGATFPVRVGNTHRFGARADKWRLKPVLRIDYVLHTAELVASEVDVGEDVGSDHLPVYARLHWQDDQ